MANKGWIKIERDIVDHWVFQDAEYFRAWMLILLMANHETAKILINKVPTVIPRGAFHSSIAIMSAKLGWTKKRTIRYLKMLEMDEMLTTKRSACGTTFFVVNWPKYQGKGSTYDTADDTAHDTAHDTARDTQTRMIKNDKEGKEARTARKGTRYKSQDEKSRALREMVAQMEEEEQNDQD